MSCDSWFLSQCYMTIAQSYELLVGLTASHTAAVVLFKRRKFIRKDTTPKVVPVK